MTIHTACLLLGSNIEPDQNIPRAIRLLGECLEIIKASSAWESASVDCCYPDFINVAVQVSTLLDAEQLKAQVLRPLESQLGQVRTEDKNAPRTIDIDTILFDGELVDPDLWEYVHQAIPVSELFPDLRSNTGESLKAAARRLAQATPIQLRKDISIALREQK